ncbi:MAG: porin [Hydrocarboniphaga sp.]|uniref:carbohydrate porin n=1 Tax=Hydrocarboniphaga sp. TaxID=2033016 RepID=UPI0026265828|nr:carbohydrate porin [Hydrocarboniphaga sp.]MDB5971201.1 porin [Hydrocarboniphaga sp.]
MLEFNKIALFTGLIATLTSSLATAQTLEDRGIKILGSYTGESAAVVDGGLRNGSAYAGQFFLGTDLDMHKLIGWDGAAIHLYGAGRHGDNLSSDEIGNSTSVQEIYGAQTERLANFTLEQKLFDDRLVLEAGRTVANIHFLGSDLCNYFQTNSACGNPTFVFRTSGFTYWPVSSWGGHAKLWITPSVYAHAGAYEVNPHQADENQHGLDWSTADAGGVITPFALGYKTTPANDRLPRMVEIGGWYDSSDYADPLRDSAGTPAAVSGNAYAERSGRSGAFFRFEQQVTRPNPQNERGLILFGSALVGIHGELGEDHFLELGLVQKGTFHGRDRDTIGFVIDQQRYSGEAIENQRLLRASAGGSGSPHDEQIMMELSYGIQFNQQLRLQPNVQYIIHPDQFGDPSRTRNLPNALVVGLRVDLSFQLFRRLG